MPGDKSTLRNDFSEVNLSTNTAEPSSSSTRKDNSGTSVGCPDPFPSAEARRSDMERHFLLSVEEVRLETAVESESPESRVRLRARSVPSR